MKSNIKYKLRRSPLVDDVLPKLEEILSDSVKNKMRKYLYYTTNHSLLVVRDQLKLLTSNWIKSKAE